MDQLSSEFREQDHWAACSAAILTQLCRWLGLPLLLAAGWRDALEPLGRLPLEQADRQRQLDIPAPFERGGEHGLFA